MCWCSWKLRIARLDVSAEENFPPDGLSQCWIALAFVEYQFQMRVSHISVLLLQWNEPLLECVGGLEAITRGYLVVLLVHTNIKAA